MKIVERSVQEIGQSFLITLPKQWTTALNVKKGSTIKIIQTENGALTIVPEYVQQQNVKHAVVAFDTHFQRRFYREYFEGNETITVKFVKPPTTTERASIKTFLGRFMNVQVIEETSKHVVLKCFRIEGLTMEECLTRMHHITMRMIEPAAKPERQELRDTTTRFYYMLVMLIRIYLSEGKFMQEKQVPLILAMDYRMVGEKVQRIAEYAGALEDKPSMRTTLIEVTDLYRKSFSAFMTRDFEKAAQLWSRCNALQKELAAIGKETGKLGSILRASKEISMLVR